VIALAAAATLAGATVQSATGFGFALLASPALFAVLSPYEAVTALIVLGLVLNLLVLLGSGRPGPARWRTLGPMLAAALPGVAGGVALLAILPRPALQVAVGCAVVLAALLQLRRWVGGCRPRTASLRSACAVGLASGALTTSTSVSGPPIVLWLESQGVSPGELRASLAASFLVLNVAGGAAVIASRGAGTANARVLLPLVGLTAAGYLLGLAGFRRLHGPRFRGVVLTLVIAAGAASAVAGLAVA
jgi:uncharacterized protein